MKAVTTEKTAKREENLSPAFLKWLVNSRTANQSSSLKLLNLLNEHPEIPDKGKTSKTAQDLLAVCFSLWRAAFLADREATSEATFAHAKLFLARLITDNAIAYTQDKSTREWTFNYYVGTAANRLMILSERWPKVDSALSATQPKVRGMTNPQRRWNRFQKALEVALECFEEELMEKPQKLKKTTPAKE